ncbi:protein LAZY 1-like [Abrus precatorius]|uniref:Protein LAZY 1-like n=1 Tax=Abrus precatorius TaxID=3816 RepID=A0A8B8L711_ABRPR|nr:protein LAZY 1-like [Abrus precatorius]
MNIQSSISFCSTASALASSFKIDNAVPDALFSCLDSKGYGFTTLFQWVHRKLRQNSIDPVKDFTLVNPCTCLTVQPIFDNQYSQTKPSFSSINQPSFIKPHHQESQTSYSGLVDSREEKSQEETPAVISEFFEGFLTIGTLGTETVTNEPGTPTFAMPLENITMRNEEVTDNELQLISYELEKFLEAEKEESFYESSGRNSYVSIITLSGKQVDGTDAEDYGNKALCPLQGYLMGSSFELPETKQIRKERTSLAELFHRTKTASQDCIETGVRGEAQVKQTPKSAMHIMKNILKRVNGSSKCCNTSMNDADSALTNKKRHKVLRMFHRKVYPESPTNAKEFAKSHKGKSKNVPHEYIHEYDNWSQHCKTNWNPLQHGLICSSSIGNNEHWIKTDAEYLVLEL